MSASCLLATDHWATGHLLPSQDLENLFLHLGHFVLAQARVDDQVFGPGLGAMQAKFFNLSLSDGLLELEAFATHEEQGHHIAKVHAARIVLAFEAAETIHEQV